MGKLFTPNIGIEQSYSINFNNRIYHPHSNHAADMGGVISSTGFQLNAGSSFTENDEGVTREYFLDDNGRGEIRLYYLDAQTRVYNPNIAGTVDYHAGIVKLEPMDFAAVSNVDGLTSARVRMTAIPDSYDIVPVRNQILELDLVNTKITAGVDATTSTGQGYTTTTTTTAGTTTTTTTVATTTSTPSSSAY